MFGFFKKLADVAKKVGSGVAKVAKKVWQVAKPVAEVAMPMIEQAGPKGAAVSQIYRQAAPIADYLLGSR